MFLTSLEQNEQMINDSLLVDNCVSVIDKGRYYRGSVSSTVNGDTCVDWDKHDYDVTPQQYPDEGLDGNYCRNPLGSGERPWCYTRQNQTVSGNDYWGYCKIQACGEEFSSSSLKFLIMILFIYKHCMARLKYTVSFYILKLYLVLKYLKFIKNDNK